MKLNYNITEELYAEVIEYQMRLHIRSRGQVLKYWLSNLLFCGMALYFLVARVDYSWGMRIMPLIMALILLGISTYRRMNVPGRARAALKSFMKDGTLAEGFIGPHTLLVEQGAVKRKAGSKWEELPCKEVGGFLELEHCELMTAGGVIFELIPKSALTQGGNREKLRSAIRENAEEASRKEKAEEQEFLEEADAAVCWKADTESYVRSMVEGHRRYYTTGRAWKGSQMVRAIILLYGVAVLCLRLNLYIGLAFVLVGILLNRQLLVTFSPLSRYVVRKQVENASGGKENTGEESFYIKDGRLGVLYMGQAQSTPLADITDRKQGRECTFLYTKSGQMYAIPDAAFEGEPEKARFFQKLLKKK